MYKFTVEIDVDGVLANMDGAYLPYIKHIIPNFAEETHIKNWGMPEVKRQFPAAYEIVKNLYSNPEFIRNLKRYENVELWLNKIYTLVDNLEGKILIHTHILDEVCAIEREFWLRKLEKDSNVKFEIDISIGSTKKESQGSLVLVEDNINNLQRADAPYKILMSRGHNRNYGIESVGEYTKAVKVSNLEEVYNKLEELLADIKTIKY